VGDSEAEKPATGEARGLPDADQLGGTIGIVATLHAPKNQAEPDHFPRLGGVARERRDLNAEARIQAAIVEWIRTVAPGVLVFAIPNGGLRTKAEAARLKWTGTLAGVPDLAIVAHGGRIYFIEVKTADGTLSADQRTLRDWLIALGCAPAICRSVDDVRRSFAAWGISTREGAQ
jgi:hypothetical protein